MPILQNAPGRNSTIVQKRDWSIAKRAEHLRLRPTRVERKSVKKFEIEIRNVRPFRNNGLEILFRAWDSSGRAVGFGRNGRAEIERTRIINPPILVPDLTGPYRRLARSRRVVPGKALPYVEVDGTAYREDPQLALLMRLEHVARVSGKDGGRIQPGKIATTTLIESPETGTGTAPIDGILVRSGVDETFSTIRGGAGTSHDDTGTEGVLAFLGTFAGVSTNNFNHLQRSGFGFDTSSIGSDTIDDATFSVHGSTFDGGSGNGLGGSPTIECVSFSPASESDFVNGDYATANFGTVAFCSAIGIGAWTDINYNDMLLNASGEGHINTSGNTFFGLRHDWDKDNSFGGTWSANQGLAFVGKQVDFAGTVDDPVLTVNHTASGANPKGPLGMPFYGPFGGPIE